MKTMAFADLKFGNSTETNEKNIDKLTNIEAEIAIIGCLLWDNKSYEKISDFLNEEHFADPENREILAIIKCIQSTSITTFSSIALADGKNKPLIFLFISSGNTYLMWSL